MSRQKFRARVVHCHHCGFGMLCQFTWNCPVCGEEATRGQDISDDGRCGMCGREVEEFTIAALGELERISHD